MCTSSTLTDVWLGTLVWQVLVPFYVISNNKIIKTSFPKLVAIWDSNVNEIRVFRRFLCFLLSSLKGVIRSMLFNGCLMQIHHRGWQNGQSESRISYPCVGLKLYLLMCSMRQTQMQICSKKWSLQDSLFWIFISSLFIILWL